MATAKVADHRDDLAKQVQQRYEERAPERTEKHAAIEEVGPLNAAGMAAAIQRTAHMTRAEGQAILSDIRPAAAKAARNGRKTERVLEEVLGGFDDSDQISFLHRGIRAARAVCRLVQGGEPVGTGFLVAPGIVLTNNHVIGSAADAATFTAEFDYELTIDDEPRSPLYRFDLDPERVFVTSDADSGLDFTFVAVQPESRREREPIATFGWLPLDERVNKILEGEPAVIIQHPRGNPKRVCLFAAELVDKLVDYLHYTTDTDGGSSGSPVMNRGWQVIALHHAAVTTDERRRGRNIVVNEGVRVSRIFETLRAGRALDGDPRPALAAITAPEVVADGRPQAPKADAARDEGNRPRRGRPVARFASNGSSRRNERTRIQTREPTHFDGRDEKDQGYKPDFLGRGGLRVELPGLPRFLRDDVALIEGSQEFELKFTHYSSVMSASRRLPFFTAVNIDGAQSQRLGRLDRDFEAADKWAFDPRISENLQLGPDVYDDSPFDFGHLTRREDPVWGDDNTARMANDDTFYMTNAAPQHSNLNQRTWLALENAVLQSARRGQVKVSVFTGPVLSPQDPTFREVQVPTAFWKIVAYKEGNRLRAHGFMQVQKDLVDDVIRRESLDGIEAAVEYQVPIREIGRDTGLDFGPLVAADQDLTSDERVAEGTRRPRKRLDESIISAISARIAGAGASTDEAPAKAAANGHDGAANIRDELLDLRRSLNSVISRLD